MGEKNPVKKKRVTGSESMTFIWVFNTSNAPGLSQIYSFFPYSDLAMCNLDERTNSV